MKVLEKRHGSENRGARLDESIVSMCIGRSMDHCSVNHTTGKLTGYTKIFTNSMCRNMM